MTLSAFFNQSSKLAQRLSQVRRAGLVVLCCAFALLPLSCSQGPQLPVLAIVGDRKITTEDLKNELERRRAAHRPIPDKETLLREMVTTEALMQRARASGLLNDPHVQHEINIMLVNKLQERELAARQAAISVTSDEVRAEYDKDLAKYSLPAKVRLAVLALSIDPKLTESKRAELRERMSEARRKALEAARSKPADVQSAGLTSRPPGFGTMAIDYSDDQASRYRGGDIGWLDAGNFSYRWPREVLQTGYALEAKGISDIIETKEGVYLVMKTDCRPGSTVSLAEVEPTLRQGLVAKKRRELELSFREEARCAANSTIITSALAAVELQLPSPAAPRKRESQPPAFPSAAAKQK